MIEILNIPDVRRRVAPITVERYHQMIELGFFDECRVELLNGILVEKMSKSPLHVSLVRFLFRMLTKFCPESRFLVMKEDPITLEDSEPEPDLAVVEGLESDFAKSNPTTARFVVEVAVRTLAVDRAKALDYARANIPEYWIVRPKSRKTEVYRGPVDGKYTEQLEIAAETTIESNALRGFAFNLAAALAE